MPRSLTMLIPGVVAAAAIVLAIGADANACANEKAEYAKSDKGRLVGTG